MRDYDEIKKEIVEHLDATEDWNEYHSTIKSLESVERIEDAKAKRELEERKLASDNFRRSEEAKAKKFDSIIQLLKTMIVVAGSFLMAKIVERGKEEGKILKSNEFMNQAMNLFRKA